MCESPDECVCEPFTLYIVPEGEMLPVEVVLSPIDF